MYHANEDRYEKMRYAYCGNSGLKLPLVSLGLWHNFGDHSNLENMKEIRRLTTVSHILTLPTTTVRLREVPKRISGLS